VHDFRKIPDLKTLSSQSLSRDAGEAGPAAKRWEVRVLAKQSKAKQSKAKQSKQQPDGLHGTKTHPNALFS